MDLQLHPMIIITKYLLQMTTKQTSVPFNRYSVSQHKLKHLVIVHVTYFALKIRNFFGNDYFHSLKIRTQQD